MATRDQLRAGIFKANKPERRRISFFGMEVEVRQPLVRELLNKDEDSANVVRMLIQYCYVPDSDEKVFEDADFDMLANMPFNKDMAAFVTAIQEMTDIDIKEPAKN